MDTDPLPDTPPPVALTSAVAAATALTVPDDDTVATTELELVHVTARPVSRLLAASRSVTLACVVCPMMMVLAPRLTDTDDTGAGAGALTVSVALPVTPSETAMICAVPA